MSVVDIILKIVSPIVTLVVGGYLVYRIENRKKFIITIKKITLPKRTFGEPETGIIIRFANDSKRTFLVNPDSFLVKTTKQE